MKTLKIDELEKPREEESSRGFFVYANDVSFRAMTRADLQEVMVIERHAYAYPWSERFFLQELTAHCARAVIAQVDDRIAGYILFWTLPDAVDIHNIAVHQNFRRRGIGRQLLGKAVEAAQKRALPRVTLEVRKSNLGAQKLYESQGFVRNGVRRGYYSDDGEDAITMALELKL